MAIPTTDPGLAAWSTNADTRLTASPSDWNMTAPEVATYSALHDLYIAALSAVNTVGARSKALVADKNAKKVNLLKAAREIYTTVQASTTITDENKTLLNVVIKKTEPSPHPAPAFAPLVILEKVDGQLVSGRAKDSQDLNRRGRAPGTSGLMIFSHAGATPPASVDEWKYEGISGDVSFDVLFPESVLPGTTVWVTACWFNDRKATSPAGSPKSAVINYPATLPMAA
jgi:hypothetical protein